MTHRIDRTITVEMLARVEGEGALRLAYAGDEVVEAELRIFEPPRLFEALLRGRGYAEAPDITSRICGICPVAYQTSACAAMEDACGVEVTDQIRLLRRLIYCGEWIESHALHIYLLHAPDFLGYPSALAMAADHRGVVEQGLRLKRAGNDLLAAVGGRAVHPVNMRVGGFYRFPATADLRALRPTLEAALDDAVRTVDLVSHFDAPDVEQPYEYLSLRPEEGYPIEGGRVVTTAGEEFDVHDFSRRITETQVPHSHALHARLDGGIRGTYAVGPLARYCLNSDRLSEPARSAAASAGLGPTCHNPFRSIVVRAVEVVEACSEALRILDSWTGAGPSSVPVTPHAGEGFGASEAPRGVLFHRYRLAADGAIADAQIVPPTSQNQDAMESDLRAFAGDWTDLDDNRLRARCEQTIRNFDPCISCAAHFLDLTVERR